MVEKARVNLPSRGNNMVTHESITQGKLAALSASCLHLRYCAPILVIIAVDHGRISCCVENFGINYLSTISTGMLVLKTLQRYIHYLNLGLSFHFTVQPILNI